MKALQQEGTDKIVSLENISVISLDEDRKRVVFNFMNAIFIFGRWTPDYHYFQYDTEEKAIDAFEKIKTIPSFRLNYFISEVDENTSIVNKKAINTINIKEDELKVIFNLNYSITSYTNNKPIEIGKFIFWNYVNEDDLDDDKFIINENINDIVEI